MTFYDNEKLQALGQHMVEFDNKAVITLVGIADVENECVNFNFVSRLNPDFAIDCLEQYVEHLRQEPHAEIINKNPAKTTPGLKIVRD